MSKTALPTVFHIEPTDYGWSVRAGSKRLGLFVTQRQALADVKQHRAKLTAKGQRSTVEVTGQEADPRARHPFYPKR